MTIDVRDLEVSYGTVTALRGVTAAAAPGRVTALVGPNASGKSTLLRAVVGAVRPTAGAVLVDDTPAHRLRGAALARRLAYVAQRPVVAARFSVREVVALGRFALPPDAARVEAALARLDLEPIAGRPFAALSVGQQQRVALARALAQLEPGGHLVLDEPTSAMDLRHARDCAELLRELAAAGTTILVAIHDLAVAAATADDAWLLDEGRLTGAGPAGDVLEPERLEALFGVGFEWATRPAGGRALVVRDAGARG